MYKRPNCLYKYIYITSINTWDGWVGQNHTARNQQQEVEHKEQAE